MTNRDLLRRFGLVAFIVGALAMVAVVTGQPDFAAPLLVLAYWLAVILVAWPYLYDRFSRTTADWALMTLILGPFVILAVSIIWWEHRRLDEADSADA